jgi:hypothetical protein
MSTEAKGLRKGKVLSKTFPFSACLNFIILTEKLRFFSKARRILQM